MEIILKLKSTFENVLGNEKSNITSTLVVGIVVCISVYWWITRRKYNLPPGPTCLPIVGYLPFLSREAFKDFDRLSKKYGNVFGLHLGQTYAVILGNYSAVKEALNQTPVLGRPPNQFEFAPDGGGIATVNDAEWTEQRRYTVRSMRDIGLGGTKWEALIQEELDDVMKMIESRNGKPLNCRKLLSESISNNITTLVFGKRLPLGDPARHLFDKIVDLTIEASDISATRNFFPLLAHFLSQFGIGAQNKNLHKKFAEFTSFLKKQVEERKTMFKNEETNIFIDGYLKEIENNLKNNLNNSFHERNLRGNVLSLLIGGTDTSTASILWLFLAMIKFPEVERKVHQELDSVLGKDGKVNYTERLKLPYTNAVLQECLRWATIVPLSPVRMALEDTKIFEYDIPKGTVIIPNIWSIHKDPQYWKEPEKFIPERFMIEDGKLATSRIDSFMPFSYGKRNCPGETVAKITIFLYFVTIMQKFKVMPPVGESPKLEAKLGITFRPVDQEFRFVTRDEE